MCGAPRTDIDLREVIGRWQGVLRMLITNSPQSAGSFSCIIAALLLDNQSLQSKEPPDMAQEMACMEFIQEKIYGHLSAQRKRCFWSCSLQSLLGGYLCGDLVGKATMMNCKRKGHVK